MSTENVFAPPSNSARLSRYYIPTRKEDPAEAEVESHKLLVRGGYVRMVTRGVYSFLPLGWRTVRKIERIVREEMVRAGAIEIHMPMVQPAELWEESGRWTQFGPELLRFKDRKQSEFCLGPTHEEVITALVRGELGSYKQLPLNLFQIQTKFRDEARPRFGLMRGREFVMKDAYSFDLTEEGALASYDKMFEAYTNICDRIGFKFVAVEADTGSIGGSRSHEFQVLAETGEDEIASCSECGYGANVEKAEIKIEKPDLNQKVTGDSKKELVDTPDVHTIEEVCNFFKVKPEETVKTLVFTVDGAETLIVLMRGDHDVNEVKLRNWINDERRRVADQEKKPYSPVTELELADDAKVGEVTKAPVGFAGPVGLQGYDIVADISVASMRNYIVGGNAKDKHYKGVTHDVDYTVKAFVDLRQAQKGDPCGRCGGRFLIDRGIEIGHVFYLGTKYSKAMGATVLDENGKSVPMEMGCYGIGVTRIMAAVIEQSGSGSAMAWPFSIAPFEVELLTLQNNKEEVVAAGDRLFEELDSAGFEVLYDDRDERAGSKFADADLIGAPVRVMIGSRGLDNGVVEVKLMDRGAEKFDVEIGKLVDFIKEKYGRN